METRAIRCDIFCRVIDNLGDAGVCWRLAHGLAAEQGWQVRLWIDDARPLDRLAPDHRQGPVGVGPFDDASDPAEVVIEAFACDPPPHYLAAMAAKQPAPAWINLEYLSAETWIEGCHRLPSPHAAMPLVKHFFFPGFTAGTGGLIRERDYDARRTAFDPRRFRQEFDLPDANQLLVSMFCYDDAPVAELKRQIAASGHPVTMLLPGRVGAPSQQGALTSIPLPFLPQARYDELLWLCDLNFVRGEDSFVRAQWAGKPFVWQIYRQDGEAHRTKLDAFLARYGGSQTMQEFWRAWNGHGALDWAALQAKASGVENAAREWAARLLPQGQLLENLASFCRERLK